MNCPMCGSRMIMTGFTIWETSSNPDVAPSLRHTYSCTNLRCGSKIGDFTWTKIGETFIMHHRQTNQENVEA